MQTQTNKTAISSTNRTAAPRAPRALSPAQRACLDLLPIFQAAKARGLKITEETRTVRLRAYNKYVNDVPGLDWIENSFKELIGNSFAIEFAASAIRDEVLTW